MLCDKALEGMIEAVQNGDPDAESKLIECVYDDLKGIAKKYMARERDRSDLDPTSLVHEAFLRLTVSGTLPAKSRAYFFSAAARAMRRVLIDHHRRSSSLKRGGTSVRLPLVESAELHLPPSTSLYDLDDALTALAHQYPKEHRIIELRFSAGLSLHETADSVGLPVEGVKSGTRFAKAFLRRRLGRGAAQRDATADD